MTKIITDNSKVNINLLKENDLLRKQVEELNAKKHETTKQLNICDVVKRTLERKVVASAKNENWFANEYYKGIDKYIVEEKEKEATELTAQIRVLRFMLAEVEKPL